MPKVIKSKIVEIKEFGIYIELFRGDFSTLGAWPNGTIVSDMQVNEAPIREDFYSTNNWQDRITSIAFHNAMTNALEAMILAHAIKGIDVAQERYIIGIRDGCKAAEEELNS